MESSILFQLIIIVVLTAINAFFAAAEMAVVSVNKTNIQLKADEGNKKAKMLLDMLKEPSRFLATIQVAITLAGFFSSAFAATGLSKWLVQLLNYGHIPYSDEIAIVVITIILAFYMLLFGELFPKRFALQKKETVALLAIGPISFIAKVFMPFVKLLTACTKVLIKLTRLKDNEEDEAITESLIRSMVKAGHQHGAIKPEEKVMINNIFEFDDTLAREIMCPRLDVIMIDINDTNEAIINTIVEEKHSRIPVYDKDKDHILGFILAKEVLRFLVKNPQGVLKISDFILKPYLVPETKSVDRLFKDMKAENIYFAMLIDEYGVFSGIVTMEDLIEEVMGDINDESDVSVPDIVHINDNQYEVSGLTPIWQINKIFKTEYEDIEYDTLSGLLIHFLGEIPDQAYKQEILIEGLSFQILEIKDNRIEQVLIKRIF